MKTNLELLQINSLLNLEKISKSIRVGKKLADFLKKELSAEGFNVRDPSPKDWGWKIEKENDEFPLWIGCGNCEKFENGNLCFIEPSKPSLRKWFKKIDTRAKVERLGKAIEFALRKPGVGATRIRWRDQREQ